MTSSPMTISSRAAMKTPWFTARLRPTRMFLRFTTVNQPNTTTRLPKTR